MEGTTLQCQGHETKSGKLQVMMSHPSRIVNQVHKSGSQAYTAIQSSPYIALGVVCACMATMATFIGLSRRRKMIRSRMKAAELEKSSASLQEQRRRMQQALFSSSADVSVFNAVAQKKLGDTKHSKDLEIPLEIRDEFENKDDTNYSPSDSLQNPSMWDDETRQEWQAFVRQSKLDQGEFWTDDDVDEGLPQVWIDLDKE